MIDLWFNGFYKIIGRWMGRWGGWFLFGWFADNNDRYRCLVFFYASIFAVHPHQ